MPHDRLKVRRNRSNDCIIRETACQNKGEMFNIRQFLREPSVLSLYLKRLLPGTRRLQLFHASVL